MNEWMVGSSKRLFLMDGRMWVRRLRMYWTNEWMKGLFCYFVLSHSLPTYCLASHSKDHSSNDKECSRCSCTRDWDAHGDAKVCSKDLIGVPPCQYTSHVPVAVQYAYITVHVPRVSHDWIVSKQRSPRYNCIFPPLPLFLLFASCLTTNWPAATWACRRNTAS